MNQIDTSSSSLYFAASSIAANNQASKEAINKTKEKKVGNNFSSVLKTVEEEKKLIAQGLPPEIAKMSDDDAIDFLKDELDMAGDDFGINATPHAFEKYKKAVGQFIKFLEIKNYRVDTHKRFSRRKRELKPAVQIVVINEQLNKLAYDMWYNHLDKLNLLKKVHEINGLVIDLLAI